MSTQQCADESLAQVLGMSAAEVKAAHPDWPDNVVLAAERYYSAGAFESCFDWPALVLAIGEAWARRVADFR